MVTKTKTKRPSSSQRVQAPPAQQDDADADADAMEGVEEGEEEGKEAEEEGNSFSKLVNH